MRVKAIGNTGCDLYIVTTLNLDKVVVCPTKMNPDDVVEVEVIDAAPGVVGAVPEKKLKRRGELEAYRKKLADAGFKVLS